MHCWGRRPRSNQGGCELLRYFVNLLVYVWDDVFDVVVAVVVVVVETSIMKMDRYQQRSTCPQNSQHHALPQDSNIMLFIRRIFDMRFALRSYRSYAYSLACPRSFIDIVICIFRSLTDIFISICHRTYNNMLLVHLHVKIISDFRIMSNF